MEQVQISSPAELSIKKRFLELDIARGLAVLLMVIEHVNLYLTGKPLLENPLFKITQDGIGNVAVIFMFIMGMNTVFSKSSTPQIIFRRGAKIFLLSYVFNFFRDFLSAYVGGMLGRSKLIDHNYFNYYELIVNVDILQFVGLAFMVIGVLRMLRTFPALEFFLGFLMSFATVLIGKLPTVSTVSNWGIDMIIGGWSHNFFPFLSWILYPIAGAFLGRYLKNSADRDGLYVALVKWSLPVYMLGWCFLLYFYPELDFFGWKECFNYYRQDFFGNVFFLSETVLLLGVCFFALKNQLIPEPVRNFLIFWSENIVAIYIVSWLFISWTAWSITGFNVIHNPIISIGATIGFIVISHMTIKKVPVVSRILRQLF